MAVKEQIACVYCNSKNVIKHGKTRSGEPRLRCKDCHKTWVEGKEVFDRPDISTITESYLLGYSIRDLVPIYKSSPHRINMKIREFLDETGSWEDFLDESSCVRATNIIYLQGIRFNCSYNSPDNNQMYLALALEGLSSNVIGFEIAEDNTEEVWDKLISRLRKRGYSANTFICKDIKTVEKPINKNFPDSSIKIYLHKLNREKEVENKCCFIGKKPLREKLIDDALDFYSKLDNQSYTSYLENKFNMDLKTCIMKNCDRFFECMAKNCGRYSEARLEQLLNNFNERFQKFHALKTDPYPIINAWLGLHMLKRMESGFTRYSLYNQIPCKCSFNCFACKHVNERCEYIPSEEELNKFASEVTVRAFHLPFEIKSHKELRLKLVN